jgi:hypothetical protein
MQGNNIELMQTITKQLWSDDTDWLCAIEFLPSSNQEDRALGAERIAYLVGYAQLVDARSLALIGDAKNEAYEILFSFPSDDSKREFKELVRHNELLGESFLEYDLLVPDVRDIRKAQPLARVLPADITREVLLVATSLLSHAGDHCSNC